MRVAEKGLVEKRAWRYSQAKRKISAEDMIVYVFIESYTFIIFLYMEQN